jgi:hypothetical protein
MKQTKPLTILLFAILLINACGKEGCPDSKPIERGIDKSYLPYIIPYSDTSTRLFLKNGTDTLVFRSQGLKETITNEQAGEGSCNQYNLQKYSLYMVASDSDYFRINYYTGINWGPSVKYLFVVNNIINNSKEYSEGGFKFYTNYPPIIKKTVLNTIYDSIYSLSDPNFEEIYVKPNIGIIKVKTSNYTLELIK